MSVGFGMEMNMIGMLAISRAGHDQGTIYVITDEEDEYVYLADGQLKTVDRPKKKNKKHIQIIKKCPDDDIARQIKSGTADDIMIRKFIQKYKADIND